MIALTECLSCETRYDKPKYLFDHCPTCKAGVGALGRIDE